MNRIYLDYAATTPVHPEVLKAMEPYFTEKFGNSGSLHSFGQKAIAAIDASRETIAKAIGADFREIIFTGSATEANNLALQGVVKKAHFRETADRSFAMRIIISSIEHESILETARDLEKEGVEVVYLPVDKNGVVDLERLKESLNDKTILVSIMYANNEIGVLQSIEAVSKIIKEYKIPNTKYPLLHTDAVQAFQFLDCNVKKLGVDLMTLSAHKIYGPKGIGALYVSEDAKKQLRPVIMGGGQEYGMRSGTENVPSIVGFGKAIELAVTNREKESKRASELKHYFWNELKKIYPPAEINPERVALGLNLGQLRFLPNILNIYFPGHKSEDLLIKLDMAGIAVSSGSACGMRSSKLSHVLKALGFPTQRIQESLRFSFGSPTTKEEIDEALKRIKIILWSKK